MNIDALASAINEHLRRALAWHTAGDVVQAAAAYREILSLDPKNPDALHLLGVLRTQSGDATGGADLIRASLAINPDQPFAHANLGNALVEMELYDAALASYAQAIAQSPEHALAHYGRGNALLALERAGEALAAFARALALVPELAVAWTARGAASLALGKADEALQSFRQASALRPDSEAALTGAANALEALGRPEEALAAYDAALAANPTSAPARFQRAVLLSQRGRIEEAVEQLKALEITATPTHAAAGLRLHLQMCVLDWSDWRQTLPAIEASVRAARPAVPPFAFLSMTDSPALQLTCAESAVRDSPFDPEHLWRGEAYTHARLRIGYLSADFTEHAVSFLTAAVFEHHDQRRFETFGFALRRDEGSATGRRMRSAFSRLIDVQGMCDADIAERIREAEIDVLVDLMGFTGGYRTGVLAFRPAPVQVNYLGFPGTLGSARADYIIADEFVIPPQHRACYREAIAYMPDCFQANSDRPALAPGAITRAQLGLPQRAFVWCSFHSSYKVNPPLFDIWARLVEAIPESVLWLYAGDDATARNIGTEAARRGMDRQRIVTGGRLPYPMHLARLACADLCLDTWPFNGGATTSDALWAGVPVVTRAGDSFASRMSGSLLRCLGLADLVGESLDEYEQIALDVARRPERLSTLRSQLASAKVLSPPFDSARFCRHLENAYVEMHRQHRSGGRPASFEVAASPRA